MARRIKDIDAPLYHIVMLVCAAMAIGAALALMWMIATGTKPITPGGGHGAPSNLSLSGAPPAGPTSEVAT